MHLKDLCGVCIRLEVVIGIYRFSISCKFSTSYNFYNSRECYYISQLAKNQYELIYNNIYFFVDDCSNFNSNNNV